MKVKKAALSVMGTFHAQLGPAIQAVALSSLEDQSLRSTLEATFGDNPYDPNMMNCEFPKRSIAASAGVSENGGGASAGVALQIDVPKLDLIQTLPADVIDKMVRWMLAGACC